MSLKLYKVKKYLKNFLRSVGIYKDSIWPYLTSKKKQFLIKNVKVFSSIDTLNDIKLVIEKEQKGAYFRFGDEDIYLMLGQDGAMHKTNKKLAKEMKEAMKCNIGKNQFALPVNSNLFGFEKGMVEDMHLISDNDALKYLAATYKYIDIKKIYTPVALHYLATFNQNECVNFLGFLKTTKPIFVGNEKTKPELVKKLFGGIHIKTPSVNSYTDISRIELELIQAIGTSSKFQVIVLAMGCPGRILQKRILQKGFNVYLFDFGSLLDAFNDENTRLWIDLAGGTNSLKSILNSIN
jgi:hypothetical protein